MHQRSLREEGKDVKMGFWHTYVTSLRTQWSNAGCIFTNHGVNGNVSLSIYDASVRQTDWVTEGHETFFQT